MKCAESSSLPITHARVQRLLHTLTPLISPKLEDLLREDDMSDDDDVAALSSSRDDVHVTSPLIKNSDLDIVEDDAITTGATALVNEDFSAPLTSPVDRASDPNAVVLVTEHEYACVVQLPSRNTSVHLCPCSLAWARIDCSLI